MGPLIPIILIILVVASAPFIGIYAIYKCIKIIKNKEDIRALIPFILVLIICSGVINSCHMSMQESSRKGVQKEASTLIASYTKASQAHYTEYGTIAKSSKDLGQYITVTGCKKNNNNFCKTARPVNYSNSNSTTWYSPSGYYEITMQAQEKENIFIAKPTGRYAKKGYGVSGCFNSSTGMTKVMEMTEKGTKFKAESCKLKKQEIVKEDPQKRLEYLPSHQKDFINCIEKAEGTTNRSLKRIQMNYCEEKFIFKKRSPPDKSIPYLNR